MIKTNVGHKVDIRCPFCKTKYSIEEIFIIPELIKGNYEETYICDNCNKEFRVKADIRFYVTKAKIGLILGNDNIVPYKEGENEK